MGWMGVVKYSAVQSFILLATKINFRIVAAIAILERTNNTA